MRCLDGPAQGVSLSLRRAPILLRVVRGPRGRWDALDQLDDVPRPGESIHVYRLVPGTRSFMCIRPGGCFEHGDYTHVSDAPAEETLRDTDRWRAWAERQGERIEAR